MSGVDYTTSVNGFQGIGGRIRGKPGGGDLPGNVTVTGQERFYRQKGLAQ
jgi:hypothetical protein